MVEGRCGVRGATLRVEEVRIEGVRLERMKATGAEMERWYIEKREERESVILR